MLSKEFLILIIFSITILTFVIGVITFVLQFRNRRKVFEKEKDLIYEKHQRELLDKELNTRKQTMQFIGSELHDSVAQKITLAALHAQFLFLKNNEKTLTPRFVKIDEILSDSLNELRDLSRTLAGEYDQAISFSSLLRKECSKIGELEKFSVSENIEENIEMNISAKIFLIRIAQEFLQNSLKYADCKKLTVKAALQPDDLYIELADDGKGFDTNEKKIDGIGLSNMRRRIESLHGTFELNSAIGNGTSLKLLVPRSSL